MERASKAKEIAECLQLRGKLLAGEIKSEKTLREVFQHYLHEHDIITKGQRNKQYVEANTGDVATHLSMMRRLFMA